MAKLRYILVQIAFACLIGSLAGCAKQSANMNYVPTGDVLYDRFALLVLDQIDEVWSRDKVEKVGEVGIEKKFDFSEIENWETEFGDDARYWQLQAFVDSQENSEMLMNVYRTDKSPYIDTQLVKNIETGFNDPGCYAALPWPALSKAEPGLGLELVEEAILADADNSYFYYIKATFLVQAGDHNGALRAVHDGNQASDNERVFPFPYNMVLENPEQIKGGGNQAVAEILANSYTAQSMAEMIFEGNLFKKLLKKTDLKPSDIDELIIAAQKLGTRPHSLNLELLKSCGYLEDVKGAIPKQSFYLNPGQISEIEKLFVISYVIRNEILDHYTSEEFAETVESQVELTSSLPGKQRARIFWQDRMESNKFLLGLHPRFDPFANPPLGSWFPANQTASPGTPSR